MPRRYLLAIAWLVVVLLFQAFESQVPTPDGGRRPAVQEAPHAIAEGEALPPPSAGDPGTELEMAPCAEECTGSAFSLDRQGLWMTARHVVEGCRTVAVLTGGGKGLKARQVHPHPRADVALLWTGRGAPPLRLAAYDLRRGQEGFSYGFPQGRPGAVRGKLLGRLRIRITGRDRFVAPAIAWAEVARSPDDLPKLGGISGGPMLDDSGTVIGLMVGASQRRGRLISAAPASLFEALDQSGARAGTRPGAAAPVIAAARYTAYGDALRADLSVAQVYCQGQRARRRLG